MQARHIVLVATILASAHATLAMSSESSVTRAKYFKLRAQLLEALDGKPGIFDGKTIGMIGGNIRQVKSMRGTRVDEGGKLYPGPYNWHGKAIGTIELAKIESATTDETTKAELHKLLEFVKDDFANFNRPFISQIQGVKDKILEVMRDSCEKRQIKNSFLLQWADTREGEEETQFRRNIQSLHDMDALLEELCNFLFDLVNSCPKGLAQYRELERKEREKRPR